MNNISMKGSMLFTKQLLVFIISSVVFSAGAFAGGIYYARRTPAPGPLASGRFEGRNLNGGGPAAGLTQRGTPGMRPLDGQILALDDGSLTLKLADGSSRIIVLSSATTYNQQAIAQRSDLTEGSKVVIFGTTNPDGSVTAQTVSISTASAAVSK